MTQLRVLRQTPSLIGSAADLLSEYGEEGSWTGAACAQPGRDPEDWFPSASDTRTRDRAVAVCLTECPLTASCYQWARRTGQRNGIWGARTMGPARA